MIVFTGAGIANRRLSQAIISLARNVRLERIIAAGYDAVATRQTESAQVLNELEIDRPASALPSSLIERVEETVRSALGIANTRHRSAMRSLRLPAEQDVVALIFRTVADNYARGNAAANRDRSQENWRWQRLQPQIAAHNKSREVVLERAIAAACLRCGRSDWANQVPVASGLIDDAADGRRAIDLVHRRGERHFELIELKIASDTPLYAAVEIIGYGCLWLLARANPPSPRSAILDADRVDLRVLAPLDYYARYDLTELEAALDLGCVALGQANDVTMNFAFRALDERLAGSLTCDDDTLLAALDSQISWNAASKR